MTASPHHDKGQVRQSDIGVTSSEGEVPKCLIAVPDPICPAMPCLHCVGNGMVRVGSRRPCPRRCDVEKSLSIDPKHAKAH